jgi:hypothetical protein
MDTKPTIKKIDEIEGISFPTKPIEKETAKLISRAITVAAVIVGKQLPLKAVASLAITASIQTVSALLAAAEAKCNLAHPPEDINVKVSSSGKLVYRCFHDPAHEWDLSGNRIP